MTMENKVITILPLEEITDALERVGVRIVTAAIETIMSKHDKASFFLKWGFYDDGSTKQPEEIPDAQTTSNLALSRKRDSVARSLKEEGRVCWLNCDGLTLEDLRTLLQEVFDKGYLVYQNTNEEKYYICTYEHSRGDSKYYKRVEHSTSPLVGQFMREALDAHKDTDQ